MSAEDIKQLEQDIENAKSIVALHAALQRLESNKDFQRVILQGYFEKEAIRLVHLKGDSSMQKEESQKSIIASIDAISALSQYFDLIARQAAQAERNIEWGEATREELLAEELGK